MPSEPAHPPALRSPATRVALALGLALALAVGCAEVDRSSAVPFEPPLLTENNLDSVVAALHGPLVVPFDHLEGQVLPGFVGVTFTSGPNDLELRLSADGLDGRRIGMALYGPRAANGTWGKALTYAATPSGHLLLTAPRVEEGRYLVLIGTVSGAAAGDFELSVGCVGGSCAPPDTPTCDADAMRGCTLSCPLGFVRDEAGCESCACLTECSDDLDCSDGEACSTDGMCRKACRCTSQLQPVCGANGVTYANACEASCEGVEIVAQEACPAICPALECEAECPNGYAVGADGCPSCTCLTACASCPNNWAPVCTANGRTFLNACHAQCRGERVAYLGACRMSCPAVACADPLDCGSLGQVPDAGGCPTCACQQEPKCDGGGRVCVSSGATLPSVCAADLAAQAVVYEGTCPGYLCATTAGCPAGTECVRPEDSSCISDGTTCLGVCLRRQSCESGLSSSCPAGYECVEGTCQSSCMCSSRYDPVCGSDGVTYDNACVAACAGATLARVGRCCPTLDDCTLDCPYGRANDANGCAICECRREPACACTEVDSPVCATASDGSRLTYLNRCKAQCDGYFALTDGACPAP